DSWDGMVANVGAAMGRFGARVLEPLMAGFKEVAPAIMDLFDEIGARIGPVMESFADSDGFRAFIDTVAGAGESLGPLLDTLKEFAPVLAPLGAAIGASGLGS